ncbi:MAG: efflux RND transporter periplasmic adaptor subunit [Sandaracinaceae bacterium]|nr:efflux RND transporter periplasmic adaptor subunit [Sandaracinaceae bacterium]
MRIIEVTAWTALPLMTALALPLAGCGGDASAADAQSAAAATVVAVSIAPVEVRQRPVALELDGTLVADEDSNVTSVVAGRVTEVLVERGSVVEEGAPLLRLRDVDYRLQARAARAQLDQARARLGMDGNATPNVETLPEVVAAQNDRQLADNNLRRAEELAQRGVLTQQGLDEARAAAANARERHQSALNNARVAAASLASARVALSQASTAASEATVRAPFGGEIADRMVSVGEYVSPQSPLVTLVRTNPLRIELSVPQRHLQSVQPGQAVLLRVDSVPDRTFEATVRYVSASVSRTTRGLTVEAVVPNPDRLLRPGLFATARLETGGTQEVFVVPATAVHTAAGVSRAFVVRDGHIEERVVSVADRTEEEVVVAEGLAAGEQVATGSLDQLADGVAVTVSTPANPG